MDTMIMISNLLAAIPQIKCNNSLSLPCHNKSLSQNMQKQVKYMTPLDKEDAQANDRGHYDDSLKVKLEQSLQPNGSNL